MKAKFTAATSAALLLVLAIAGTALAWAPSATGVCNADGTATWTVTLHLDGSTPGTYIITDKKDDTTILSSGSYVDGQVVPVADTGHGIGVTETQGQSSISQGFGPKTCPTPPPTGTGTSTPSDQSPILLLTLLALGALVTVATARNTRKGMGK